jgi:hypothetical protein
MSNATIKEIVGTVMEVSSAQLGTDKNLSKRYPFVMIRTDDGELIKVNNLLVDAHVDQVIRPGQHAKFYVRTARIMMKKANFLLATESDIGIGVMKFPVSLLLGQLYLAVLGGLLLSAFIGALLVGPFLYYFVFGHNFTLTVLGCGAPLYFLVWNAVKLMFVAGETSALRHRLTGSSASAGATPNVAVKEI